MAHDDLQLINYNSFEHFNISRQTSFLNVSIDSHKVLSGRANFVIGGAFNCGTQVVDNSRFVALSGQLD